MKHGKTILRVIIGTIVLVGIGWYLKESVDADVLRETIETSNIWLILAAVPVILLSHVVRGIRWKRLLSHVDSKVSIVSAFNAILIGYAANTFVPRSGELLRPYALSRSTSIKYSSTLGSVVVERVVDVLTLLLAIVIVLVVRSESVATAIPGFEPSTVIITLALPAVILAVFLGLVVLTPFGERFAQRVLSPLSESFAAKVAGAIKGVAVGASVLKDPKRWPAIAFDSALMWSLYVLPIWLILQAMPWQGSVDIVDSAVLLVMIAIGVTIAPTPGALGVYQTFAQIALVSIYGATNEEGLAFGVVSWVLNYGVAVIVGGVAFIAESKNGFSIKGAREAVLKQESSAS